MISVNWKEKDKNGNYSFCCKNSSVNPTQDERIIFDDFVSELSTNDNISDIEVKDIVMK